MKIQRIGTSLFVGLILITLFFVYQQPIFASPSLQILPTATAVQVSLPTPLPILPTATPLVNVVPINRSPTPEGASYLEAITEANVRSQPDPESERLGTIRAGEQYAVIGRYFRWYEFQYSQSPSGTGWVFDELVNISGNANNITDLTVNTPTPDAGAAQLSGTLALITQTPGGVLTATAGVGALPLPLETNPNGSVNNNASNLSPTPLPTFTAPPNVSLPNSDNLVDGNTGTPEAAQTLLSPIDEIVLPSRIPPILPILLLGGAGILGLVISSARR